MFIVANRVYSCINKRQASGVVTEKRWHNEYGGSNHNDYLYNDTGLSYNQPQKIKGGIN